MNGRWIFICPGGAGSKPCGDIVKRPGFWIRGREEDFAHPDKPPSGTPRELVHGAGGSRGKMRKERSKSFAHETHEKARKEEGINYPPGKCPWRIRLRRKAGKI
jgi:hypothetical protein